MCTTLRKKSFCNACIAVYDQKARITSVCKIDKLLVVFFRNRLSPAPYFGNRNP